MLEALPRDARAVAFARARAAELAPEGAAEPVAPAKVEELFGADDALWAGIAAALRQDVRACDRLLLRLNLRRSKPLEDAERQAVLRFLALGYRETGDVRYFNELLWFNRDPAHPWLAASLLAFRDNLHDGVHHRFPLADAETVHRAVEALRPPPAPSVGGARGELRVALLGPPHAFTAMYPRLKEAGHAPRVFDFPAGERRPLQRRLRALPLLSRLYFRLRGAAFPFRSVPADPGTPAVTEALAPERLDVGVHQLPFIIRKHLIGAFRLGILNDHLAALPYLRGRSSVEYSLLFGFPVAATLHWVDEGVDTGPLLSAEAVPVDGRAQATVAAVKALLAAGHPGRIIRALDALRDGPVATQPNPLAGGLQHFVMHPALAAYVEGTVLPRRRPG